MIDLLVVGAGYAGVLAANRATGKGLGVRLVNERARSTTVISSTSSCGCRRWRVRIPQILTLRNPDERRLLAARLAGGVGPA